MQKRIAAPATSPAPRPLMLASMLGQTEAVRCLTAGSDANARNKEDATVLGFAIANGYTEIVRVLLEAGADPI